MTGRVSLGSECAQSTIAAALLDPALPCPQGLHAWNGSDPTRRFAIHRNNVVASLVDALAETFTVTQRLVGVEFFRAMAAVYVREKPPATKILAHYGDDFPEFVKRFPPAAAVPYLGDMARLEYARVWSYHAADVEPLNADTLARALANPEQIASLSLVWHPSVRLIDARYAVVSLWAAHQRDGELPTVDIDSPESAVVLRHGLEVIVVPAAAGTTMFVRATQSGMSFGQAAAEAQTAAAAFNLTSTLAQLVPYGALVAVLPPSRCNP